MTLWTARWRNWLTRRDLIRTLVLMSMVAGHFLETTHAAIIALPQNGETEVSPEEVVATPTGVKITVTDRDLYAVLQAIQNISGIHFKIAEDLRKEPVTALIEAPNWSTAVQKLLKHFNRLEIFGDDQALQRVLIVGKAMVGTSTAPPRHRLSSPSHVPPTIPLPPPEAPSLTNANPLNAPPDLTVPSLPNEPRPPLNFSSPATPSVTAYGSPPSGVPGPENDPKKTSP